LRDMLFLAMLGEGWEIPETIARKLERHQRHAIAVGPRSVSHIRFDNVPCTAMWYLLARILTLSLDMNVVWYGGSRPAEELRAKSLRLLHFIPDIMPRVTYEEDRQLITCADAIRWFAKHDPQHLSWLTRTAIEKV